MIPLGSQSRPIAFVLQQLDLHPEAREMLFELLSRPSSDGVLRSEPTREHINDESRIRRTAELVRQGARKHPAARQACREDPAGPCLESCQRRVANKYDRRLKRRLYP
jgi:hypothetical protein